MNDSTWAPLAAEDNVFVSTSGRIWEDDAYSPFNFSFLSRFVVVDVSFLCLSLPSSFIVSYSMSLSFVHRRFVLIFVVTVLWCYLAFLNPATFIDVFC